MSARSYSDQHKEWENGTKERLVENNQGLGTSASQDLTRYLSYPVNKQKRNEEEVDRLLATVSHEIKQINITATEELEKKNIDLCRCLIESEIERKRYRNERDDLRKQFHFHEGEKFTNKQEVELRSEIEELKQRNEQIEKEWTQRFKELQETCDAIIKEQKLKNKQIKEELEIREIKIKHLDEKLKKTEMGFTDWNEMKKPLADNKEPKLTSTEKELGEANSRLADNGKLTESNQNFVELSDTYRPTKMAEKYAELYDNQWTDAFEEIEKYKGTEAEVIRVLLEILMDVMRFCEQRAKRQMEKLQSDLTCSDNQSDDCVPYNVTKQLKDLRKVLATAAKGNLYQLYLSILKRSTDENYKLAIKIEPFVKECFDVCWFMAIQDPPIVLCTNGENGGSLDTNLYRAYTKSGRYIEYVVWPAMLLHESGLVLAKGVAQGTKDQHHQISKSAGPTKPSYKQSTVPTMGLGTKPYVQNQRPKDKRNPTPEEMRRYFYYVDRRDYLGAHSDLGHDIYMKCAMNEHKRSNLC